MNLDHSTTGLYTTRDEAQTDQCQLSQPEIPLDIPQSTTLHD